MRVIQYPKTYKGKMEIPNYLIHNIDNYNYVIYREITEEESENQEEYKLLHHENSIYLLLSNTSSEEKAMLAIESYWMAIIQLEGMIMNESVPDEMSDSQMKKYRLGYDYLFLADKSFSYGGSARLR